MLTESALRQAVLTFDLKEHADRLDDRTRDTSLGLLVMVIGAGNFGKSSLINAICGRPVAPVSVIPKTFKIDVFTYGKPGTALVRHVGDPRPVSTTHDRARKIEAEREAQFRLDTQKRLAEIVWRYDDLNLPAGVSIVDTPGISQAIGKAAKSVSLASVLGSTFEVDEVWAHWFHRADVVVWAFCANKMEDSDTLTALEAALGQFDKPIIPVATKADLIPRERWPEVTARFNAIYGPLLQDRQAGDLHLTVCAGKSAELVGTGIPELRASLVKIGAEALEVKRHAEASFVRDESNAVARVLDETAKTLVSNLRAIASLGDQLAEEAIREADRGRQEAVRRVNDYLAGVRRDPQLAEVAKTVHAFTRGGRSGDVEAEARKRILELIDDQRIERDVNEAFAHSARSLEATADRLSRGTDISRLGFKSSGKVTRSTVPLKLRLKAFKVTSNLDFSMGLKNPTGFIGSTWDAIKRIFGLDRFSLAEIQAALSNALVIPDSDLEPAMEQAIREGFAPALRDAVESALAQHIQATDADALTLLGDVDRFLPALQSPSAHLQTPTYGPQAEYWATLSPAVETLLGLAKQELTRLIPDFQTLLTTPFAYVPPAIFPPFGPIWKARAAVASGGTSGGSTAWRLQAELHNLLSESTLQLEDTHQAPFLPYLEQIQQEFLEQAPVVSALDSRLDQAVTGVRYRSAGSHLAQAGAEAFQSALANSTRQWEVIAPHEKVGPFIFNKGTLAATVIVVGIALCLLFVQKDAGIVCLSLAFLTLALGVPLPYLSCAIRYRAGIADAMADEIEACQSDAAAAVGIQTVDQIIQGMSAELAPRPLQKLLMDVGLLQV